MPSLSCPRSKNWTFHSSSFSSPAPLLQLQYGQPLFLTPEILRQTSPSSFSPGALRYPHFWGLGEKLLGPPFTGSESGSGSTDVVSLREYCKLEDRASILLLRDISHPPSKSGSEATSTNVSFDTWFGIRKSSPAEYMNSVHAWSPDIAVSFHDEIHSSAGSNRTRACVERASLWLQECIDIRKRHQKVLKDKHQLSAPSSTGALLPALLAFLPCVADNVGRNFAIEKILSIAQRSHQQDDVSTSSSETPSSIAGFVLGCLGQGETRQERKNILSEVIPKLPETQLRLISGVVTPLEILDCIALGIDLFDSDYPNVLTSAGLAATFQIKYNPTMPIVKTTTRLLEEDSIGALAHPSPRAERHVDEEGDDIRRGEEMDLKRKKAPTRTGTQIAEAQVADRLKQILTTDPLPRIYLRSSRFLDDESPLLSSCGCFACSGLSQEKAAELLPTTKDNRLISHPGHMKCYVNHLLETGELLGHVLLTAHNVYHFNSFFAEVRASIEGGYFEAYREWFITVNNTETSS